MFETAAFQEVCQTQLCVFLVFWNLATFPTHHSVFDFYNINNTVHAV